MNYRVKITRTLHTPGTVESLDLTDCDHPGIAAVEAAVYVDRSDDYPAAIHPAPYGDAAKVATTFEIYGRGARHAGTLTVTPIS